MAQQLDIIEQISDDLSIAQGLLGAPIIPLRHRTSFTSTTTGGHVELYSEGDAGAETRHDRRRHMIQSSNTWTASSGGGLSEVDDIEDRTVFVNEYNRLALKHGVRTLLPENSEMNSIDSSIGSNKSGSWFARKILRKSSSSQSFKTKGDRLTKHRRSISDLSLRFKLKQSDTLKDKDLQELVRLCGMSLLYLPTEYAASSLAVPTCFRATAQYLVQHASTTRGVFRISGSHSIVASLYNHYCTTDNHGEVIAGTVRCPTLPDHIRCDVHDVASAFKKFISGLPGGILGSLPLFDAFISIQSQLNGVPELTRTKQSKVRARLIALAIATLRSQYRRELICAVFGLLSMIGRAAEIAPRENSRGRPLDTTDLMGYGPLGIVFGPLLVGELLDTYTMRLANPHGGLVLLPVSSPKPRKERSKKSKVTEDTSFNTHVDKIKIANGITEMLITHWRDVVRHMRNLKALRIVRSCKSLEAAAPKQSFLRSSASESFALRRPPDWDSENSPLREVEKYDSPTPAGRGRSVLDRDFAGRASPRSADTLTVRKQRARARARPKSSQMLSGAKSMSILSPTKEENLTESPLESNRHPGVEFTSVSPPKIISSVLAVVSNSTIPPKPTSLEASIPAYEATPWLNDGWTFSPDTESEPKASLADIPEKATETLPEHDLEDCSDTSEEELQDFSAGAEVKMSLIGTTLLESRKPDPPAMILSRVPSSGRLRLIPTASRRISASEPGLRPPENPHRCSPRSTKSTYGDSAHRVVAVDWAPQKDPLARVSVADDLASLAELAHVLEEESAELELRLTGPRKPNGPKSNKPYSPRGPSDLDPFSSETRKQENRSGLSEERYGTFRQLDVETCKDIEPTRYELKKDTDRPNLPKSAGRPKAIGGPSYTHLPGGSPNPKKKSIQTIRGLLESPNTIRQGSPLVATRTSVFDAHPEQNESAFDQTRRMSVKDLAAKFNTDDSRSLSSPVKSPIKTPSDTRAVSDTSPKDKIIAPYTTNPPSPTKSQKSGKSDLSVRSIRLAPPLERNFAKLSPPRRLLRADLKDTTPLRSVRASLSESAVAAVGTFTALPSGLPICCSLPSSPQPVVASYDGGSARTSVSNGSDPGNCPPSHYVHIDSQNIASTGEQVVTSTYLAESSSVPIAFNHFAGSAPTRSNSVLHSQIQTLQQQLKAKTEEVRYLKQQLVRRSSLDIGALSEELRETKKELKMWKSRAEIAEKQLEMMRTLSVRGSRNRTEASIANQAEHSAPSQSKVLINEDGPAISGRIRRAVQGMDGATSFPNASEESTDTVLRDSNLREDSTLKEE